MHFAQKAAAALFGFAVAPMSHLAHAEGGAIKLEARCYVKQLDSRQFGERTIAYLEQFCGITNAAGGGFMHRVSFHGPVFSEATPSSKRLIGYNVIVDQDKDEIYMTIERQAVAPDPGIGRWTITGGTGKYQGISGRGTYEVEYLPPVVAGSFLNTATLTGQYDVP